VLGGTIEVVLLLLVLRSGRIELVAWVVLFAYASQAVIYLPFLRSNLGIAGKDLIAQLWPLFPSLAGGYFITRLLPASFGETLLTLAIRALFTGLVVAFIHGLCTRFRCFHEASKMIVQNVSRGRLAEGVVGP
jgi:hypothetical protein